MISLFNITPSCFLVPELDKSWGRDYSLPDVYYSDV
jgi:hypothetical protein